MARASSLFAFPWAALSWAAVVGCGLALGCSSAAPPAGASAPGGDHVAEAAQPAAPPGWKMVSAPDIGLSVLLPERAKREGSQVEGLRVDTWLAEHDGAAYVLVVHPLPPAAKKDRAEGVLRDEAGGFILGCHGQATDHRIVPDAPHPTLRALGTCQQERAVLVEVHLYEGRLYTLAVVVGDQRANEADFNRFFGSFRLGKL